MLSEVICLSQYVYQIFAIAYLFLKCQFSSVPSISVPIAQYHIHRRVDAAYHDNGFEVGAW